LSGAGKNDDVRSMSFENALQQLEQIVGKLEQGSVPLEDSIELYERGEALKERCAALLGAAEARIQKITLSADGRPTGAQPLDPDQ
jgi:exodeoxyribonuclease VII small subunit